MCSHRLIVLAFLVVQCAPYTTGRGDDPPVTLQANALAESYRQWQQREEAKRAVAVKSFREAFQRGQALDVRQRLLRAVQVTHELAAQAQRASAEELNTGGFPVTSSAIFLRDSHLARLMAERPWIRDAWSWPNGSNRLRADTLELRWPTEQEHDRLRTLLGDRDADVQAMAIEALATLHDPDDVQLIADFLLDKSPAVAVVLQQSTRAAVSLKEATERQDDPVQLSTYWQTGTLQLYAQRALRSMTGYELTAESFEAWIKRHGADRNRLWFWQRRTERAFDQLDLSMYAAYDRLGHQEYHSQRQEREAELRRGFRAELAKLSPSVEAKVVLLANPRNAGGPDITDPQTRFFDSPWRVRLSKEDLFKLLDGEQPWSDVEWQSGSSRPNSELYTRLVERITLSAEHYFDRQDVPRLQALLARHGDQAWRSGRAAWLIGISRLLPSAAPESLDDAQTRDGALRSGITQDKELFVRDWLARELVRVGLPLNGAFLKDTFFRETTQSGSPDVRGSILQALYERPLTMEKRSLLIELIADPRCRTILTGPTQRMGDDLHRSYAVWAINAHAGRELVDFQELQSMRDPRRGPEILDQILKRARDQFNQPDLPK